MTVYTYPNITQANYNTPGFYHTVQNKNCLVHAGFGCNFTPGTADIVKLEVSQEGTIWGAKFILGIKTGNAYIGILNEGGIAFVRMNPVGSSGTVLTLIVKEFYFPVCITKLGS